MKCILWILMAVSFHGFSQTFLQGTIRDSEKKIPLPFCGVTVKGSFHGGISNEDGVFKISANPNDSVVFSFLGYKPKTLLASFLVSHPVVFLEPANIIINEVVIHADDEYIYDIMQKCRRSLNGSSSHLSKVCFNVETMYQDQPAEMVECYYNGSSDGACVKDLRLKSGRIGLAVTNDSSYFVSLNTSKAISFVNLTQSNEYLPLLPFQLSKSKMRKLFSVKMLSSFEEENPVYHIGFSPRNNNGTEFAGEAWIDKNTFAISKINLHGENLAIHPFLPLFAGTSIDSVSVNITMAFDITAGENLLNNLVFNYQVKFKTRQLSRSVATKGIMYFYDFNDPFILPHFNYDENQSDYRKITFLPYNASFWKNSSQLIYTERQQRILNFLKTHGILLNFDHKILNDIYLKNNIQLKARFFEDNYIYWSDTNRISIKKNKLNRDSAENKPRETPKVKSDLYHLKSQIFLDVNPVEDSLQWLSATVFDSFESFFNLPEEKNTNGFINIFFDICEIERRKMEKTLKGIRHPNLTQIDSVYRKTLATIDNQTGLYLKKVQSGKNYTELKKWNDYVVKNLRIDNFKIFGITEDDQHPFDKSYQQQQYVY